MHRAIRSQILGILYYGLDVGLMNRAFPLHIFVNCGRNEVLVLAVYVQPMATSPTWIEVLIHRSPRPQAEEAHTETSHH